ncbi:M15 family metallopeptidase [Niallia sp. 03133]|uniref:M15 family metallopeptidase n=1 Tax=Niallia sp. 03133 TaxID=3458060 RepID=UPI004044474B
MEIFGAVHEEALISLSAISKKVKVHPYYYKQGIAGAFNDCLLREGAANKIKRIAENLPNGLSLVVLDGWRSYETQLAIYEQFQKDLQAKGFLGEALKTELSKYVAFPSKNIMESPPHLTGGAVDLTIADQNGWLPMGTKFDEFSEKSKIDWYEEKAVLTENEKQYRQNRKLLKDSMLQAGFVCITDEWWHFEYGTRTWASKKKTKTLYHGVLNT